ncbi:MAG: energy transducer TonB [Acidobacteria bacterium]|nr:energy transducer TonB [Acidobacteriota bacterium]
MKRRWIGLVVCVLVAQAFLLAQQSSDAPANKLAYEDGSIANHVYSNDCFGFSFPIPEGWQVKTLGVAPEGKAIRFHDGGLVLLMLDRPKPGSFADRIFLNVEDAKGAPVTPQEFVSNHVRTLIKDDSKHGELLRDANTVEYAGKQFVRADSKQVMNERPLFTAFIYTKFRGFYIGETAMAGSKEDLDEAAKSMEHISFREDQTNSNCVNKANDPSTGIVGGMISSTPGTPSTSGGPPLRVRVTQGVSTGLLIYKVQPQYPEVARNAGIQGQVVLQAEIDKNGDMREVHLVSGDPLLAPAALEAVRQWKYRPYLLDGQPVAVDTQVIVNFALSGR